MYLYPCALNTHIINLCCHVYAGKKTEEEKSCCRLGNCSTRAQRKLSAQIAFLELIISFYVIHLSVVIVCQSNAVAARYEVECKFCLGNSLLCTKKTTKYIGGEGGRGGHTAGFTFTITVMIQSSLTIIPLPRMSVLIEKAFHSAYQTAVRQHWHQASHAVIYTAPSISSLFGSRVPLFPIVCFF